MALPSRSPQLLSAVVPCFNEEEVLPETHRRLAAALGDIPGFDFELIYVDDGSRDSTLDLLRALQAADPRVRVLALSRNFGHQIALTAGLAEASGDVTVAIDADLQDPPELVADMLARWRAGADSVYGLRIEREGETRFKRWTASLFYRLLRRATEVPIPLDAGDFRLMDRKVVDAFLAMPERDRFVRGMVAWTGFRQEALPYRRAARAAGETKYPLARMVRFAADGILSFSLAPLRLAVWLGFFAAAAALGGIVYALTVRLLTDDWISGWAGLFIAVMFFGGLQLALLGVLGEYVGRTYGEAKRRPLYLIRERLGFPDAPRPAPAGKATGGGARDRIG